MLGTVIARVDTLAKQGKSRDEIIAAHVSAEYDPTNAIPYIKPQDIGGFVYDDPMRTKDIR